MFGFRFIEQMFGKKNQSNNLNGNFQKLYFDRNKQNFIDIQVNNDITINDILENNKEEIFKRLQDNLLIQKSDYSFVLIDEDCPLTQIKLKLIDCPYKFLKKRKNLYYLNINEKEKPRDDKPQIIGNLCKKNLI